MVNMHYDAVTGSSKLQGEKNRTLVKVASPK